MLYFGIDLSTDYDENSNYSPSKTPVYFLIITFL